MCTTEYLDQCAFARAILTEQRQYLTGLQCEVDPLERLDGHRDLAVGDADPAMVAVLASGLAAAVGAIAASSSRTCNTCLLSKVAGKTKANPRD